MKRASLIGLVSSLGALLGSGCGEPAAPPAPDNVYVDLPEAKATASGYAWDPEAFFLSVASCNEFLGGACPIPPLLADLTPFLPLASVQGAQVFVLDPIAPPDQPPAFAQPTGPDALWRVESLPSRDEVPYFVANTGQGALLALPPEATAPLPPVAPAPYLPTVTLRPFFTGSSRFCPLGESIHTSTTGVLDAVARYRSSKGLATNVADFINPARFSGVLVFWQYAPAPLPNLLIPADRTTVQAALGTKYHLGWRKPGTGGSTQSPRGFYVADGAASSPIGVTVVVLPAGSVTDPTAPVQFLPVDTVTDAAQGRPYVFAPLPLPAIPGLISAMSVQLGAGGPPPDPSEVPYTPIPSFLCLL
ncbi:hypothetical protein [Archangium primigenium]|uniref:hypothetical protein n=1 Tax=[Archangium] primigenium TaxID=2792470 RepID=UPI00195B0AD3|nr:hypothetical protein [Archangium primigenium]MBM7118344.1 hypothetical protein [Archangium primigenium]